MLPFQVILGFLSTLALSESHVKSESGSGEPVLSLSDASHDLFRANLNDEWLILLYQHTRPESTCLNFSYADWCGACKVIKPYFHDLASWVKDNKAQVRLAAINYADSPSLLTRFRITQLPSIFHVKNGEFRDVSQQKSKLRDIIAQEGWKKVEPIRPFFSPFSPFSNITAYVGLFGLKIAGWLSEAKHMSKTQLVLLLASTVVGIIFFFLLLSMIENYMINRNRKGRLHNKKD